MNLTLDELSPLLGLNSAAMYSAIQELGTDHVVLSSDCGEPLLPNSVEAMRQIRAYRSIRDGRPHAHECSG